ncbi:MAG: hypothetical protein QXF15_03815 [Candidatus Aenigmatarchaeota archaeon]
MGVDIYMAWNKMTKEEEERQYTGFNIYKGYVGYLRASAGMHSEIDLLHRIFPEQYWEKGDYLKYDFIKNHEKNIIYIYEYLLNPLIEYEKSIEGFIDENIVNTIISAFGKLGIILDSKTLIEVPTISHIDEKIKYAASVIEFLWLGIEKQKGRLNPKVFISW